MYLQLLDDGFSQKPKHVASNKPDINVDVVDSLCPILLFVCHSGLFCACRLLTAPGLVTVPFCKNTLKVRNFRL